jgi:hypothetical protein
MLGMAVILLVGVLLLALFGGPDRGRAAEAGGTGSGHAVLRNSSDGALPAWGADHVVNPTPVYTPSAMRNAAVAGNPVDPQKLIAGYENTGIKLNETDYAGSIDAGRTWVTGAFTDTWGMRDYIPFGDVNVGYDGRGTGYFTTLAISNTGSLLAVLTTTDSLHWGSPSVIAYSPYTEYRSITSLAIDQRTSGTDAGSAYLFYFLTDVNQEPMQRGLWMRASRDEGSTWSAGDTQVSDSDHLFSSYPDSVVASDGTIYASWEYLPGNSIFSAHELYLDRSTDGGRSWGIDRLISGAPIVYVGGPDSKQKELVFVQTDTCQYVRLRNRPSIGVSPTDPNVVYAAWNDGRWESTFNVCGTRGQHSDIAFSRSTDGGLTWTAPMRVNDDPVGNGAEQFEPTLAVAADGTLGLTWYDQRYNQAHNRYNLVYSQSTDGGNTWSATALVSDRESNPDEVRDAKQIDDIGFRKSLLFGQGYAIASWLDTRLGNRQGDFFVDNAAVATNTPTVTPTATATTAPTQTACAIEFTDVLQGSPFYAYVQCLACRGIIAGYPNGTFRPGDPVTRGQLAKIVSGAAGWDDLPGTQTFEDVAPGATFYTYTERLATRGFIGGYACGGAGEPCNPPDDRPYYRPNADITRGQITKIVANAAGLNDPPGAQLFEDVVPGSTFYTYTQNLANLGVMSGYPCGGAGEPCGPANLPYFRPQAGASRGQVAKIVSRTFFPNCSP